MSDVALLEVAARAARIHQIIVHSDGKVYACDGPGQNPHPWNPLDDDGDTLRLANSTGTCIEFGYCMDDAPIVRCGPLEERENWPQVGNFPDPGKATRRAVVEAVVAAQLAYEDAIAGVAPPQANPAPSEVATLSFQKRVEPWLLACFGEEIANDSRERNHRFLEEALELVQAGGCTVSEARQLVEYVFGRPAGEVGQEAGGVMVTFAAFCRAHRIDMHEAGEVELARIWTMLEKIRVKHAGKPKHSPLPGPSNPQAPATYNLLGRGDIIQRGDEALADDTVNWLPLVGWEVGLQWDSHLVPMRRRLEAKTGESRA